jgi:pantoate--beta-alanine ligase
MQRLAFRWRNENARIGFVPTMGYLHAGHLNLIKRARQLVGKRGKVVVSIYINPTQFGPKDDLGRYPRDLERDKHLCRAQRVDALFVPVGAQMYTQGGHEKFSTFVIEESLSQPMEGVSRPTHFRGVTTIVAKLFNIVRPDIAIFGEKDFQQAAVIRRMVRDLNFPVKVVVAPTFREQGGLALSSRNTYLSPEERQQSTILWWAIQEARRMVKAGTLSSSRIKGELKRLVSRQPAARLDYLEVFDPKTLLPVSKVQSGSRVGLAVFIGNTRLIDNGAL